jgi:hypothetical protein
MIPFSFPPLLSSLLFRNSISTTTLAGKDGKGMKT